MANKSKQLLWCFLGALLYSIGVNVFMAPCNLYAGGITGVAQLIINGFGLHYKDFNLEGILYFVINIPIFLYAYKVYGSKFLGKSLFCIVADTVMLTIIPIPATPVVGELLTTCIMGGVLTGLGAAFVVSNGISAGGGTDLLGMAVSKNHNISVGKLSLTINILVYMICGILYSLEIALYSFIVSLICSTVVDRMHKQNRNVSVNVLTRKPDEVVKLIFDTINRGATVLNGRGGYSGEKTDMVVTVMSEYEYERFFKLVKTVDENAFVFVQPDVIINGAYEKRLL